MFCVIRPGLQARPDQGVQQLFPVINIAEDQQRIRVLRKREMSGALDGIL